MWKVEGFHLTVAYDKAIVHMRSPPPPPLPFYMQLKLIFFFLF